MIILKKLVLVLMFFFTFAIMYKKNVPEKFSPLRGEKRPKKNSPLRGDFNQK